MISTYRDSFACFSVLICNKCFKSSVCFCKRLFVFTIDTILDWYRRVVDLRTLKVKSKLPDPQLLYLFFKKTCFLLCRKKDAYVDVLSSLQINEITSLLLISPPLEQSDVSTIAHSLQPYIHYFDSNSPQQYTDSTFAHPYVFMFILFRLRWLAGYDIVFDKKVRQCLNLLPSWLLNSAVYFPEFTICVL